MLPMKDQKAETITNILVDVFARLGNPDFLHSDQGRNFEFALLKETYKSLGIIKTHTTAYITLKGTHWSNVVIGQFCKCYYVSLKKVIIGKKIYL